MTSRRTPRARTLACLVVVAAISGTVGPAPAVAVEPRTFHVSATGSDLADGRSPTTAWRSLERASRAVLAPGDRLLLQGGATFGGSLQLDASDAGDPLRPVVIGSFGTGRARIAAAGGSGLFAYDTAGVQVQDLVLTGDAAAYRSAAGISFYNDLAGDRKLAHVRVSRVDVSGFRHGVMLGGGTGSSGYRDVRVTSSRLHDNLATGLLTYGPRFDAAAPAYAHEGVTVSNVHAYRNLGDPLETVRNTGSGIVLGSVRGGLVVGSVAHSNGAAARAPEGPVGIWTYDSHKVVIESNVSHSNRTGGPADGGGFDLDQNVSGSVLQYNVSYGNDGPGLLAFTAQANGAHRGNTIRFNLSQGDARRSSAYGAVTLGGRLHDLSIHSNTVVALPNGTVRPPVLKLMTGVAGSSRVAVRNNVLVSAGAGPLLTSPAVPVSAVALQGNAWSGTSPTGTPGWRITWGSSSHSSLASWRGASGQEVLAGRPTGLSVDPGLVDPVTPLQVTSPLQRSGAAGLSLRPTSALLGRGLDLAALTGVGIGPRDFFGNALPLSPGPFDVGAHRPLR